jgi:hypothetical protein
VGSYAAEFTLLPKYCSMLVLAKTDWVHRFVKGLRLYLRKALIGMAPASFSAIVEIASRIEGEDIE